MDIADQAQPEIDRFSDQATKRRAPVAPLGAVGTSECQECGLEIPPARQLVVPGTQHCTECAGLIERGLI